jgi:kynurenine formamidase
VRTDHLTHGLAFVGTSTRLIVACGMLLLGCAPLHSRTLPDRVIDLTYGFDDQTIYWPTNKPFRWERKNWGTTAEGYWYASADFSASEHGGTHIDAPIHFGTGRQTVDQISPERLIGPAVVIDVRAQCLEQPDYELRVEDLLAWEAKHGRMPDGAIVLMLTGWGQHWPDRKRYLGSDTPKIATSLHFPGFSSAAAEFLIAQRGIRGVGIDTASIDPGRSQDFAAHRVLNGADVYALENVAALTRLPPYGDRGAPHENHGWNGRTGADHRVSSLIGPLAMSEDLFQVARLEAAGTHAATVR